MKTIHIFMISVAFLFNYTTAEEKQTITIIYSHPIKSVSKAILYALSSVALSHLNKEEKGFLLYWASTLMALATVYAAAECLE